MVKAVADDLAKGVPMELAQAERTVFRGPAIVAKERSAGEGPSPRSSMTRVPHPLAINAGFVRAGRMRIAAASFANAEAPKGFFAMTVSCRRARRIDWTPHRHTHDRHPAG